MFFCYLCFSTLSFAALSLKSDCQILRAFEDLIEFGIDELLLLYQFIYFWILPKLDCFYQAVVKLFSDTMGCLHFNIRVTNAYEVCYELILMSKVHIYRHAIVYF